MEENLPETREYTLGNRITIVRDPQQGTLFLTDGFLHSDRLYPEQFEMIEFKSEKPIRVQITSKLLPPRDNQENKAAEKLMLELTAPKGYDFVFNSNASKRAKDGTLGVYEYFYNRNIDSWFAQVHRQGSSNTFLDNPPKRMFLGSINNPDDKLGNLLIYIEKKYLQMDFQQKKVQNINGKVVDSQFAKSVLNILEHEGYLMHKRSISRPWTDDYKRTKKELPEGLEKRILEMQI